MESESEIPIVDTAPENAAENPICIIGFEEPEAESTARPGGPVVHSNPLVVRKERPQNGHRAGDKGGRATRSLDLGGISGGKANQPRPLAKWSKKEDTLLLNFVRDNGKAGWARVGRMLGRTGKQCRNRFYNALDPELSAKEWSPEEDLRMVELHKRFGCRWATLARHLPGRGQNTIKNHWNCVARTCRETHNAGKKLPSTPLRDYIASLTPSLENRGLPLENGAPSSNPKEPPPLENFDVPLPDAPPPEGENREGGPGEKDGLVKETPVTLTLANVIEEGPTAKLAKKLVRKGSANNPLRKRKSASPERGRGDLVSDAPEGVRSRSVESTWRLDQISQWITEWAKPGDKPPGASSGPLKEREGGQNAQAASPPKEIISSGLQQAGSLDSSKKRDRGVANVGENESSHGGSEHPGESPGHFDWKAQLLAQWTSSRSGHTSPEDSDQMAAPQNEGEASLPMTIPLHNPRRNSAFVPGGGVTKPKARRGGDVSSARNMDRDLPIRGSALSAGNDAPGRSAGSGDSMEHFDWKAQWAILSARHPAPEPENVQQPGGGVQWENIVSGVPPSQLARYAAADVMGPETNPEATSMSEASTGGAAPEEPEPPLSGNAASPRFSPPESFTALMKEVSDTIRRPPAGATRVQAHKPQASGDGGELPRGFGSPSTSLGFVATSLGLPSTSLGLGPGDPSQFGGESSLFRRMGGSPLAEKQPAQSASENHNLTLGLDPGEEVSPEEVPNPSVELMLAPPAIDEQTSGAVAGGLNPGAMFGAPAQPWGAPAGPVHYAPGAAKPTVANPALTKLVTEHLCRLLDQQARQFNVVDPGNPTRLDPDQVLKLREQHAQMRAAIAFLSTLTRPENPGPEYQEGDPREGYAASAADASVSLVSPSTPDSASSPLGTPFAEGGGKRPRRGGRPGEATKAYPTKPVDVGPLEGLRLEEPGPAADPMVEGEGWQELGDSMAAQGDQLPVPGAQKPGDGTQGWAGLEDPKAPGGSVPGGSGAEWHQWLAPQVPAGPIPGPEHSAEGGDVAMHGAEEQRSHSGGHSGGRRAPSGASSDVEQRFAQCFLTWPDETAP